MAINVGIGDLAMILAEEEDEDGQEARALYRQLSETVQAACRGILWEEPELLPERVYSTDVDQVSAGALDVLRRSALSLIGEGSHLCTVSAGNFYVPVELESPVSLGVGTSLVGSSLRLVAELEILRPSLGIASRSERPDVASDDIATTWHVLYFAAADSVRYKSAVRVG